ncbi:MAG TPA: hypothetical protein VE954_32490 [Oligoflexus sp.]|uniref:hypothetical protein n=1 Tax=Oligoflexus sp. TaxID=1971216 RepID=UPI002D620922|nr:hypothetical protein [Oligoflexus sp.]HYX37847.1 hypothetical protein [Oligoflexus sp.]
MRLSIYIMALPCLGWNMLAAAAQVEDPLHGVWKNECIQTPEGSLLSTLELAQDKLLLAKRSFSDAICQSLALVETYQGEVKQGPLANHSTGTYPLDMTLSSLTIEIATQELADNFNQAQICGNSDWAAKKPQVFTDSCLGLVKGETTYTIASLSGNQLKLGLLTDSHDGSSPERRPIDLDDGHVLTAE